MLKYRIKQVNDDWLLFIPLIGWIAAFMAMMFNSWNNTYKLQKRFLFFFWKDVETIQGEKNAIYKCNELNGIHNHTSEFVYLHFAKNNETIIKVEYCPVCGEILSKKKAYPGSWVSSYKSIKKFKDITKCNINGSYLYEIDNVINNKNEN